MPALLLVHQSDLSGLPGEIARWEAWMSFTKAVENRFNRLKKQRDEGRITEDEFLREVEKLQFEDEQGRLWMIDAYSGNWYFEENGQWVSDEPPKFEPEILCSRCGESVQDASASMCKRCQAEVAAALAQAKSSVGVVAESESPSAETIVEGPGVSPQFAASVRTDSVTAHSTEDDRPEDPEERGWVSESEDEQRAQFFYDRGVEHFDAGDWQEALDFFEQALQVAPSYRDARKLASVARNSLEKEKDQRMVSSKLSMLYERAEEKLAEGQWQDAYDLLQEVLSLDAEYRDARSLSEQALAELVVVEEQRRQASALGALYRQGEKDFKAERWGESIELLSQVKDLDADYFADDPRYAQSLDMLAEAERQQQLETLYADAVQNIQEKRWGQAVRFLQEVVAIEEGYRDAQDLLEAAERQDFIDRQRAIGLEHLTAGRWAEAAESLCTVTELEPNDQAVQCGLLYARGREYVRAENWREAIDVFGRLMSIDASYRDVAAQLTKCKTTLRLQSTYQAAVDHLEQGHRREALRAFEMVVGIAPDYRDVSQRLIETRTEIELADLYDQGLRSAEGYRLPEAIIALEQVVAKRDDYRDAADRLTELKRLKRLSDLYSQGVSAFQVGKWSEAVIDFKRVVETDPTYRDAAYRLEEAQRQDRLHDLYNRGLECLEDKDWTRAIEYFEQVVQEDEIYRDAMARLMEARRQRQLTGLYREGEARFAEGNWEEAVAAFEKMLSLDPTDEWGVTARMREGRRQRDLVQMYTQAIHLYDEQRWEEASQLFEKLIEEEPNYQDSTIRLREIDKQEELASLFAKANEYRTAGQWDAAVETYQRILKIDKDYETVSEDLEEARQRRKIVSMYQEGQTLMGQQRWARAAEVFERLLALEPGREDVMARLAEAKKQQELVDLYAEAVHNLEQGHCGEAVECFEKVIHVDASYRDAQSQLDEARERQKFSQLLDRGKTLYEQEDFEGTISVLRRALELDPQHDQARDMLQNAQRQLETVHYYDAGLRYFENGQWVEAIDFLSRVVSHAPDFRDASARLESAKTQQKLDELYQIALKAVKAKDWSEAVRNLEQIVEVDGNYKDASDQLVYAREQIHARLTAMYNKGKEHLSTGRWQAAIDIFERLQGEDAGFADVERLLREARTLQEQTELAALYEQGMRCLVAGDWALASEYLERVQARAPDYKDVGEQLRLARQRQLRAYVSEAGPVASQSSSYGSQPRGDELVAEPEAQQKSWPFATILFGLIGLFLCCVASLGIVLIAGRSYPLSSQISAFLTPATVSMVASEPFPTVGLGAGQITGSPLPALVTTPGTGLQSSPVPPPPEGGTEGEQVELITSTLGVSNLPTGVATQELIPTVRSLRVPGLPTWTPVPLSLPDATSEPGTDAMDVEEKKPVTNVPPAVQQAMEDRGVGVESGAAVAAATPTKELASGGGTETEESADGVEPPPTPEPTEEALAPLSGKIAFSVYEPGPRQYSVYIANVDGSGMTSILSNASAPALSQEGSLLAYRSWDNSDRRIMVFDLTSGQYTRLTGFAEDSRPDWSQDGVLVFNSSKESDRNSRLYTVGFWVGASDQGLHDESGRATLGDNASWLGTERIAYNSCAQGCGIFVANPDGSGASRIIDNADRVSLDGSPDGNRIVYAARRDAHWDISVIDANGSGGEQLTDDDAIDWLPTWSPDGAHIAFVSNRDGNWAVWAMTADGNDLRKLFDLPGSPDGFVRDEPAWSSQGWIEERISWAP